MIKFRTSVAAALRWMFSDKGKTFPAWPEGRRFAFTIIDDTDQSTLENITPVYELLADLGLRTTKTVWSLAGGESGDPDDQGHSLADEGYRDYVVSLQNRGFEIAMHGAKGGGAKRAEIEHALEVFRGALGDYPAVHVNHASNRDNVYWGEAKFRSQLLRRIYRLLKGREVFEGELPESEYFWGDLCRQHINYVVDFSFRDVNTLGVNPDMPCFDPDRNYVKAWFQTSDGGTTQTFVELLSPENLDLLEDKGGACLVYTHFGKGFSRDGHVQADVEERLRDIAGRNGWFVPAKELLGFLQRGKQPRQLSVAARRRLQLRWLIEKAVFGAS